MGRFLIEAIAHTAFFEFAIAEIVLLQKHDVVTQIKFRHSPRKRKNLLKMARESENRNSVHPWSGHDSVTEIRGALCCAKFNTVIKKRLIQHYVLSSSTMLKKLMGMTVIRSENALNCKIGLFILNERLHNCVALPIPSWHFLNVLFKWKLPKTSTWRSVPLRYKSKGQYIAAIVLVAD